MVSSLTITDLEVFVGAALVGGFAVNPLIKSYLDKLRAPLLEAEKKLSKSNRTNVDLNHLPVTLGKLERVTYIAALVIGLPQFIAVWLGLKTAGGLAPMWKVEEDSHLGQGRFIMFEIGNLLSLAAALGSYYLFVYLLKQHHLIITVRWRG